MLYQIYCSKYIGSQYKSAKLICCTPWVHSHWKVVQIQCCPETPLFRQLLVPESYTRVIQYVLKPDVLYLLYINQGTFAVVYIEYQSYKPLFNLNNPTYIFENQKMYFQAQFSHIFAECELRRDNFFPYLSIKTPVSPPPTHTHTHTNKTVLETLL